MNFLQKMDKIKAKNLNVIVLAYVGDAVHSLFVRENLAKNLDSKANKLHSLASKQVNAHSQAELADRVLPFLSEEELDILKRGRNSKTNHTAKNQSLEDYKKATAFEALLGYLFLIDEKDRILELLQK